MNKKYFLTVIFILSSILMLYSEDGKGNFSFSANRTEAMLAEGREHTVLEGNAVIITDERKIEADRIDIYGKDFDIAVCNGNVTVNDSKNDTTLKCESLKFNRNTEIIIVDGYSELEDRKNELVTKSGFIEDKSNEEFTILQIGVRILKISDGEVMSCRAEYAGYDRKNDILELTGLPRVYWKGDTYEASRITINLETDEIKLEGNVSGSITTEDE